MASRLYAKSVPSALALRKAQLPSSPMPWRIQLKPVERSPFFGTRFTPTPFTVVYLAERKSSLRLNSAKCQNEKTFSNLYSCPHKSYLRMRYCDTIVYPGYDQDPIRMSRKVVGTSEGFLVGELPESPPNLAEIHTNRTSWKVHDFNIFVDETYFNTAGKTWNLTNDKTYLTALENMVHRVGYIELSGAMSKQEIAELEKHPEGGLANAIVDKLESFLIRRSAAFPQYQEDGEHNMMHVYERWKKHMRCKGHNVEELF
jgi:hypothetical protein